MFSKSRNDRHRWPRGRRSPQGWRQSSLEERTSGEYIFLFRICEKNYIYNYYKKSADIYMICEIIRIRIRNAREISQPVRKAKLNLKELDNCQVGDQLVMKYIHENDRS